MITTYHESQLSEMNYHVQRLNRLGFACAQTNTGLRPNEFKIFHSGENYQIETCGDFADVLPKCVALTPK